MSDKLSRCSLLVLVVAHGHAQASDVDDTRHPLLTVLHGIVIKNFHRLISQRDAVGNGRPVSGRPTARDLVDVGPDSSFRRPTHADDSNVWVRRRTYDTLRKRERDKVSTHPHGTKEVWKVFPSLLCCANQQLHKSRNGVPHGHPVTFHKLQPLVGISLVAWHDNGASRTQRSKYVPDAQIKTQGRQRKHPVLRTNTELFSQVGVCVQGASVVAHDALRDTSGPRSVQQIRKVIWRP